MGNIPDFLSAPVMCSERARRDARDRYCDVVFERWLPSKIIELKDLSDLVASLQDHLKDLSDLATSLRDH